MNRPNITNLLDKTRIENSVEDMHNLFDKLIKDNSKEAFNLLNDEKISFTTMFLLKDKIIKNDILKNLNLKSKIAIEFSNGLKDENKKADVAKVLSTEYIETSRETLKWIIESGYSDDSLNNDFDEVLDIAAILLSKEYNDTSKLPIISDLIFERHKRGYYIHDLVWAFFESCEPKGLQLIAEHLKSQDEKESKLASKLLSFIPGISVNSPYSKDEKHSIFNKWFEENSPFLYYTGESFQLTSEPIPYAVKLDAKYLCKKISADNGQFFEPLTNRENTLLRTFNKLNADTKMLLSSFSYMTYLNNNAMWAEWIKYPIPIQIKVAKAKGGLL